MKYKILAAVYGTLLTAFSAYVVLDAFVLGKAEQSNASGMNLSLFAEQTAEEPVGSDIPLQTTVTGESAADRSSPAQTTDAKQSETAAPASGTTSVSGAKNAAAAGTASAPDNDGNAAANTQANAQNTQSAKNAQSAKSTQSSAPATTAPPPTETVPPETEPPQPEYLNDDRNYQDENITIAISEYNVLDTAVYVADVTLSSPQYLKTAFANNTYGKNITAKTSETAAANGAIFAVNGDFYGAHNRGYVIRNGILYRDVARDGTDFLCIMADGSFFITTSAEYSAQELLDMGAWQCFMFGPRLIENGGIAVDENSEVARAMASNPRTAIGMIEPGHYLFVVSDGRTSESDGLSLNELANFMQSLGCQTAYNLDGGGSSTMYFQGSILNNPTTSGNSIKERSVSDIVYIGY